jgi:uncharacterized protein YbaR (Trm112 family)
MMNDETWNAELVHLQVKGLAFNIQYPIEDSAFTVSSFSLHHSSFSIEERMAIDPELLDILACPNCKTKVELVKNGTALKCGQCKRVYPIRDDIPVMLLDEATVEQ